MAQQLSDATVTKLISNLEGKSKAEKMVLIGQRLIGNPYVGGSLEAPVEKLQCKLDGFDCYTYVETVLALTLTAESQNKDLATFLENIQFLRYRDGVIDGYGSRIHYFFDWTKQAENNRIISDLTPELGIRKPKLINFMSTHRNLYAAFKTDNKVWSDIKEMEAIVNEYPFYEIPKTSLSKVKNEIQSGDIVAFTSTVNGLDVNHEGIAVWQNDDLHLMHASSEIHKVILADETLESYINRVSKHAGLMVVRINE